MGQRKLWIAEPSSESSWLSTCHCGEPSRAEHMIALACRAGARHLSSAVSPDSLCPTLWHACPENASGLHSLLSSVQPAASTPPSTTVFSKYFDHQANSSLSPLLSSPFLHFSLCSPRGKHLKYHMLPTVMYCLATDPMTVGLREEI